MKCCCGLPFIVGSLYHGFVRENGGDNADWFIQKIGDGGRNQVGAVVGVLIRSGNWMRMIVADHHGSFQSLLTF